MRMKKLERYRLGDTSSKMELDIPIPRTPEGRVYRYSPNYRAGPGCLNSFPRKISGVLPGLVCSGLPYVCHDGGRA